MTYELAKQLKDAGFPQRKEKSGDVQNQIRLVQSEIESSYNNWPLDVYIPTLSELIWACGDDFAFIKKEGDGIWFSRSIQQPFESTRGTIDGLGKSPEEAVANLWLALKKK